MSHAHAAADSADLRGARNDEEAEHDSPGSGSGAEVGELSDGALLEGIRAGSEAHFTRLYERYYTRIYAFVYRRSFSHADAEEVVQETFTSAFCSLESYQGQSSLLAWIYGIARNCANSHIRRSTNSRDRLEDFRQQRLAPTISGGVAQPESPDQVADLHDYGEQLKAGLRAAGEWQAEIFEMRHLENLSIPQIAERTRRSHDAIRSSLYRTKRMFLEAAGVEA